jgi:Beta propeller domain
MSKGATIGAVIVGGIAFGALFLASKPEYSHPKKTSVASKHDQAKDGSGPGRLVAFKTDAAWSEFESKLNATRRQQEGETGVFDASAPPQDSALPSLPPPPPLVERKTSVVADAAPPSATNPEITNNQNAGVDEGGIVKQIGPYLLALQDGRIFSVDTRGTSGKITLADRLNVYTDPQEGAWYDEMLVQGDRVLITAYSYQAQATAISVFRIDMATGKLSRDGIFYVSSQDYYSSENYATRIVGDKLVLHITSGLMPSWSDERAPAIWVGPRQSGASRPRGVPLITAENLYRPIDEVSSPMVQTIVICPLGKTQTKDLSCQSQSFIGPRGSELLVTSTDVFLWNGSDYWESDAVPIVEDDWKTRCSSLPTSNFETARSANVFRVPIDGGKPSFAPVRGRPSNQFAMEVQDQKFFMLSRWADEACEARSFEGRAQLALTTIPLTQFDDAPGQIRQTSVTALPGDMPSPEVRFMEGWMVYHGVGQSIIVPAGQLTRVEPNAPTTLFAAPLARPTATLSTAVPHGLNRLQPMAGGMLAIGQSGPRNLSMSWLNPADAFKPSSTFTLQGRVESEGRSHAFSATQLNDGRSLMGLPTIDYDDGQIRDVARTTSSNLSFFAMSTSGVFSQAGDIAMARAKPNESYKCEVSCVDWYGNSRAIFTGGRIFALMGTQIVEGRLNGDHMDVSSRLDMTGPVATN